jgi:hypothetical protein
MPSKAAEFLMSPQLVADIKAKEPKANAALPAAAGQTGDEAGSNKTVAHARTPAGEGGHHSPFQMSHNEDAPEEMRAAANRVETGALPLTKTVDRETAAALVRATSTFDAVPFAYAALQPAKEEYAPEALEERRGQDDDESDGDSQQQYEDEDTRRERLAREAVDDLLRAELEAEPDLKINRDSSQADRAYALYQRMAGF